MIDADGPPDARPSSSAGRRRYFSDGNPTSFTVYYSFGSRPGTPNFDLVPVDIGPLVLLPCLGGTPDRPQSRSGSSKILATPPLNDSVPVLVENQVQSPSPPFSPQSTLGVACDLHILPKDKFRDSENFLLLLVAIFDPTSTEPTPTPYFNVF